MVHVVMQFMRASVFEKKSRVPWMKAHSRLPYALERSTLLAMGLILLLL